MNDLISNSVHESFFRVNNLIYAFSKLVIEVLYSHWTDSKLNTPIKGMLLYL